MQPQNDFNKATAVIGKIVNSLDILTTTYFLGIICPTLSFFSVNRISAILSFVLNFIIVSFWYHIYGKLKLSKNFSEFGFNFSFLN